MIGMSVAFSSTFYPQQMETTAFPLFASRRDPFCAATLKESSRLVSSQRCRSRCYVTPVFLIVPGVAYTWVTFILAATQKSLTSMSSPNSAPPNSAAANVFRVSRPLRQARRADRQRTRHAPAVAELDVVDMAVDLSTGKKIVMRVFSSRVNSWMRLLREAEVRRVDQSG